MISIKDEEHSPEGPTQEHLVEELAGIIWRKRRLRMAEAAVYREKLRHDATGYQTPEHLVVEEGDQIEILLRIALGRDARSPDAATIGGRVSPGLTIRSLINLPSRTSGRP